MLISLLVGCLSCLALFHAAAGGQCLFDFLEGLSVRRICLLIFVASFSVLVVGTWSFALTDRDEAVYAAVAREMLVRGKLLVPSFLGRPWLEKPPLLYWFMQASMSVLGQTTFAVRFPVVLSGALLCVAVFLTGKRLYGKKAGIYSAFVFASSFIILIACRAVLSDALLCLLITMALMGFLSMFRGDSSALPWLMLYLSAGLTFLTKYFAGIAVIGLTCLLTIVSTRRFRLLKNCGIPGGVLLVVLVASAWFYPANIETGGKLYTEIIKHNFGRAAVSMQGHSGPFFYYIVLLPLVFFPWCAFLPASLAGTRDDGWLFLASWAGGTIALFSCLGTKLPHYVIPALVPLSVFVGFFFSRESRAAEKLKGRAGLFAKSVIIVTCLLFSVGMPVGLALGGFSKFGSPALAPSIVAFFMMLTAIRALARSHVRAAVSVLGLGTIVMVTIIVIFTLPSIDTISARAEMGRILLEKAEPEDVLVHWGFIEPSLIFYSRRLSCLKVSKDEDLYKAILGARGRVFCVLPGPRADALIAEIRDAGLGIPAGNTKNGRVFTVTTLYDRKAFNLGRSKWRRVELLQVAAKGEE